MSIDSQPLTLSDFKLLMAEHEQRDATRDKEMMDEFMSAFPNGEPLPHRAYHQSKIDAARAEREFWEVAKVEVFKRGLGGVMHVLWIVAGLALLGLSVKIGVPIPFIGGK